MKKISSTLKLSYSNSLTIVAFSIATIFCFACTTNDTTTSKEGILMSRNGQESVLKDAEKDRDVAPIIENHNIPVTDFSEIEKLLQKNDDTLRVFNFWATWCKPCVEELPLFQALSKAYTNQALQQVFISLDFTNKIESKLIPFLKTNPLPGDVIVLDDPDANSWIDKVDPSWSGSIPATIFLLNGKTKFHEGKFNEFSDIQKIIQTL